MNKLYALVTASQDIDDPSVTYIALVLAPQDEFDQGAGNFYRATDESFDLMTDTFGEENLISGLTHYTTFVFDGLNDEKSVIDRACALAYRNNVELVWDNEEFANIVRDEFNDVYDPSDAAFAATML